MSSDVRPRPAALASAWSTSVDLPTPGSPPSNGHRAGDQPAAEDPVELADAGRDGDGGVGADRAAGATGVALARLRRRPSAERPARERRVAAPEQRLFNEGVPLAAGRAAPGPARRAVPAGLAAMDCLGSRHAATLRGGCHTPDRDQGTTWHGRSRLPAGPGSERDSGVGAGSCELDGRRLEALDGPEDERAVLLVDDHRLAHPEFLPEDLLRERVLHELLDGTAQRPRAELGLVALRRRRTAWLRA